MRLTKFDHACVRLERDGQILVLDPGSYSDPTAMDGADAVLITHEHQDHFDEAALRGAAEANPGLRIWTNGAVAAQLDGLGAGRVQVVGEGDAFTAAGFEVQAHGEWHAVVHPDWPAVPNVGFLVDGIFHPGDALTVPDQPVETLLLPVHAPWSKLAEVVDYTNAVSAKRAYALHDAGLSEIGLGSVGFALGEIAPNTAYTRLAPGAAVNL
ncbi:L-ascorbate metabolism protein UlaG (beta-lactamase superfamily) [Streptacidiphilus sp. MAP12-20]|uniref:MBL fold metallo-hydrolase n=1 Tax=Streptacidiphilus sp. MAP12-20 TaxID=3156299 RepID=UPI0035113A8F